MGRELLPEELIQSLLQQLVVLTLKSHGFTAVEPLVLNLLIETVENRNPRRAPHSNDAGLLTLLRRAVSMANTQRRTIPSLIDLNYAFLMENIHTYSLEDEMARWPSPPQIAPSKGILITVLIFI